MQVLKKNQRHVEVKCAKAATSLGKCNKRSTDLHVEFDAMSEAMQMIFQEQEEEDADAEMIEEEERGDVEPSGPQGVAGTEDTPLDPAGDVISPEEDAFLMQQASQSADPTDGSHSPRSKAGTISGEMANLSLTSPSQPGPGEDETQQ